MDRWVGEGGARVRELICSLTALPRPKSVRKPHPLDGLVTWSPVLAAGGKLPACFKYHADSIVAAIVRLSESIARM
jgi:hypothetical protein